MDWPFEDVSAIIFGACVALMNKPLAGLTESWNRAAMKMEGGLLFISLGVFGR
jgi:hypothetical protein